jgi:hypothetical protein
LDFLGFLWPNQGFQWVTANPNKKIPFSARTRSGCERRQLRTSSPLVSADMDPKRRSSSSRDHSPFFGFWQENGGYGIFRIRASPASGASVMTRHKQVAAEIDVHAEVLPVVG